VGSRPNASATARAPDLFRTPSLRNSRVCTFSTVFGAMPRARAVCRRVALPGYRRVALPGYRRAPAVARTGTMSGTAPAIASASESLRASSEARCAATSAR
jgi:hypothetical protein